MHSLRRHAVAAENVEGAGMTPITELRLRLFHAGFHPVPCAGKIPAGKGWQEKINTNDDEIALWEKVFPQATNTGLLTRFMPTIDVDVTNPEAADAIETLARDRFGETGDILVRFGQAPKRAIPFRTDAPFKKVAVGLVSPSGVSERLEILGDGQQVIADGVHPTSGKPYAWRHDLAPGGIAHADLPPLQATDATMFAADVAELLVAEYGYSLPLGAGQARPGVTGQGQGRSWDDLLAAIGSGAAGLHDSLRSVASKMAARGWDAGDAASFLYALMDHAQQPRHPEWAKRRGEIPGIIQSGFAKFTKPGTAAPQVFTWHFHGDPGVVEQRAHLVRDLLPEVGAGLISGQWGTYKTFTALDLAGSVMSGQPFAGFPVVRKGGVLFVAVEGAAELPVRLGAVVKRRLGDGVKAPFGWVENCPRLLDPKEIPALIAMVQAGAARLLADHGVPVALIVFDTAGKAAGYTQTGDENDAIAARIINGAMTALANAVKTCVVGIEHFGKDATIGTRGSSGKEADCDFVLALLAEKDTAGSVTNPRLAIRKRKTGENGLEFPFTVETVETGEAETTLVINWSPAGATAAKPKGDSWSKATKLLRQVLMNMLASAGQDIRPYADGPIVRGVDRELVRAEFYKSKPADGDAKQRAEARRKAFNRSTDQAHERELVGIREIEGVTWIWLAKPTEGA
jgi:hypothetical protein